MAGNISLVTFGYRNALIDSDYIYQPLNIVSEIETETSCTP